MRLRLLTLAALVALPLGAPLPATAVEGADPASETGELTPRARVADTPTARQIRKFDLTARDLRRIGKAQQWASKAKARTVRKCRSGNNFRLVSGRGSGAFWLSRSDWRAHGGRRFGVTAARAPKFAQKLVASNLVRADGPLACPTADWMRLVYAQSGGTPLGRMLIPGSHDSGASNIQVTPPCTTRLIAGAPPIYETASKLNPCVVAAMAKAQQQNLGAQLRGGIRYLDLRVGVPKDQVITKPRPPAKNPLAVPLVLHHEFVSQPLRKGLGQVLKFAGKHPKEQIVLDFQHIDLTGKPGIDRYYYAALNGVLHEFSPGHGVRTTCQAAWSRKRFPVADSALAERVPIRRAWRKHRNLVVLMPDGMVESDCYRDREDTILSLWPNTQKPAVSKRANADYLAERQTRTAQGRCVDGDGNQWCGLFVSQLQLSIQSETQVDCVLNSGPRCSLLAFGRLVNDNVAGSMTRWTKAELPTNIAIIDFAEQADPSFVDRLITLNWWRSGQLA